LAGPFIGRNRKFYNELVFKASKSIVSGEPFEIPEGYTPEQYVRGLVGFPRYLIPSAQKEMKRREKEKVEEIQKRN